MKEIEQNLQSVNNREFLNHYSWINNITLKFYQ